MVRIGIVVLLLRPLYFGCPERRYLPVRVERLRFGDVARDPRGMRALYVSDSPIPATERA